MIGKKNLNNIYSDISNFRINREDLSRVSYLKKGYPLSLEDFLKIFKPEIKQFKFSNN